MEQIACVANKDNIVIIKKCVAIGRNIIKHRRLLNEKKRKKTLELIDNGKELFHRRVLIQ